jgi:hypothetical protein
MRIRKLAIPLCSGFYDHECPQQQTMQLLSEQPPLLKQLWLLLPARPAVDTPLARQCILQQRRRGFGRWRASWS